MNCNWIIECSDNSSQSRAFSISNFKISIKNNDFSRNTQNHKYWSSIISVKWKGKQADISSICENRVMSIIIASLFHIFSNQSCVSSLAFFYYLVRTYRKPAIVYVVYLLHFTYVERTTVYCTLYGGRKLESTYRTSLSVKNLVVKS